MKGGLRYMISENALAARLRYFDTHAIRQTTTAPLRRLLTRRGSVIIT